MSDKRTDLHRVEISETRRSENFIDIYANQLRLNMSPVDLTLTFGTLDDQGPNNVRVNDLAAIRMSPQTFKALTRQLAQALERFEHNAGPIHVDFLTDFSAMPAGVAETQMTTAPQLPNKKKPRKAKSD